MYLILPVNDQIWEILLHANCTTMGFWFPAQTKLSGMFGAEINAGFRPIFFTGDYSGFACSAE
jgi:hypothetical protein